MISHEHAESYRFQSQSDILLISYKRNRFAFPSQWEVTLQPQLKKSIQQLAGPILANTDAEKWIPQ